MEEAWLSMGKDTARSTKASWTHPSMPFFGRHKDTSVGDLVAPSFQSAHFFSPLKMRSGGSTSPLILIVAASVALVVSEVEDRM